MRAGTKQTCRTECIIRRIDRENRAAWFRRLAKRVRRAILRAIQEAMRFLALVAGTSLFAFIAVPAMEFRPERTLVIAEMLAVLAFGVWLGGRIYAPRRKRKE